MTISGSSRALWNRSELSLESDEVMAQLLDRGDMATWRALYAAAAGDANLRRRIKRVVLEVPTPLPRFWLAALASLGEAVDFDAEVPDYFAGTGV
jgi:hypothetical protein